jgi:hypothetical protein
MHNLTQLPCLHVPLFSGVFRVNRVNVSIKEGKGVLKGVKMWTDVVFCALNAVPNRVRAVVQVCEFDRLAHSLHGGDDAARRLQI